MISSERLKSRKKRRKSQRGAQIAQKKRDFIAAGIRVTAGSNVRRRIGKLISYIVQM
jgi:hypothetical protein